MHSHRPGPAVLVAFCVLVFFLTAPRAFAQFSSGFTGNVSDQTGAALVGAKVTVTNEATLVAKEVVSNDSGYFNIPSLPGGTYTIEVTAAGFKNWKQTGVRLESNQQRRCTLHLFCPRNRLQWKCREPLLAVETDKSDTSREIGEETVSTAPLVGRNVYTSVIELAPGITGSGLPSGGALGSGSANNDSFEQEAGYQINAAGQRQENNEYDVDGSGLNSASRDGVVNLSPEPDFIQAIRVMAPPSTLQRGATAERTCRYSPNQGPTASRYPVGILHQRRADCVPESQYRAPATGRHRSTIPQQRVRRHSAVPSSRTSFSSSGASSLCVRRTQPPKWQRSRPRSLCSSYSRPFRTISPMFSLSRRRLQPLPPPICSLPHRLRQPIPVSSPRQHFPRIFR